MEYTKSVRFFPNECYICKSTNELKRCQCNMISYCGEDHRLQHLSVHESFCKAVVELLTEKGVSHICEELFSLFSDDWNQKQNQIYDELEIKLTRSLSPLEEAMFYRPRVCFDCHQYKQEELSNCSGCPMASFCKKHPTSSCHEKDCSIMRKYLNLLTTADEFNVDLEFLSSCFPFTSKESELECDSLTCTMLLDFNKEENSHSRLLKVNLLDFIDVAAKLHTALQQIYYYATAPSEIVIHFDTLRYQHAIIKENYWEFLMHLNSDIKELKIVITGSQDLNELATSLCQNCHSMGRNLSIESHAMPYEEYMLQECYQKPNVLIYFRIEDEKISQQTNKWSQVDCPIILLFDSAKDYYKTRNILQFLSAKFQIIYKEQLCTPFSDKSPPENDDYVIIFKSKGTKSGVPVNSKIEEIIGKEIQTKEIQLPSVSQGVDSKGDDCKTEKLESERQIESQDDKSAAKEVDDNKLEPGENEADSQSQDAEKKVANADQKSEDSNKLISPSSSVSSFVIIPEPGNDESNAKKEDEDCESAGNKSVPESRIDECNDSYVEEEGGKTVDPGKSNFFEEIHEKEKQSGVVGIDYLEKYISFIQNENVELRQHLSTSIKEITKLQKKNLELQEICSKLVGKIKLIKEAAEVTDELGKDFS